MNKIKYFLGLVIIVCVGVSCSNLDESAYQLQSTTATDKLIFSEPFTISLGNFKSLNSKGKVSWSYSAQYTCAVVSGYISSTRYADTAYLVSPVIDLSSVSSAYLKFDEAGKFFSSKRNEATVWVSDNYDETKPINQSTWTQVSIPEYFTNTDYTFINTGSIDLKAFAGKKINIVLKYISTTSVAGTWEVKNFSVYEGISTSVIKDLGNGTEESPYLVKGAIENQIGSNVWVKGYIVGYIWTGSPNNHYCFSADTCTQTTNILLADTIDGFYLTTVIPVQLPTGVVRNALNLVQNKTLIGKKVTLYGQPAAYFSVPGLKSVSYYKLEDGTSGGNKPIDPTKAIFYESLESSFGTCTTYSVTGAQVWGISTSYKCALMNGYANSSRYVNDDWLITPAINLPTTLTKVATSFTMAGKYFYGTITSHCKLYISTNYVSGAPSTANWTELTIPNYDTSDNFSFTDTGEIDITSYKGNNIHIAIRYTSDGTTTGTGSLEIKNFVVY